MKLHPHSCKARAKLLLFSMAGYSMLSVTLKDQKNHGRIISMFDKDVYYHLSQLSSVSAFTLELRNSLNEQCMDNMPSTARFEIETMKTLCTMGIGLNKFFKAGIRQCMPLLDEDPNRQTIVQYVKSIGMGFLLLRQINISSSLYLANNQVARSGCIMSNTLQVCETARNFVRESKKLCKLVSRNGACTQNYTDGIVKGMEGYQRHCRKNINTLLLKLPKPCPISTLN